MYYIYAYLLPILILVINYYAATSKPKRFSEWVRLLMRTMLHELGYMFFIFYLDTEQKVDTGWAFLTLVTILIPIAAIVFVLWLFFLFKEKRA